MKLTISADIDLAGSRTHARWVTRLEARVTDGDTVALVARLAVVHVGEMADALGDLAPTMKDARLEAVHDIYFEDGWYKDDFADGAGIDLLFVESIMLGEGMAERNLDLAVIRRIAETLGSGCQLVVQPYRNALEAARWAPLGFTVSTHGRTAGLMHLKLGQRNADIVQDESGVYEIRSNGAAIEAFNAPSSLRRRACN